MALSSQVYMEKVFPSVSLFKKNGYMLDNRCQRIHGSKKTRKILKFFYFEQKPFNQYFSRAPLVSTRALDSKHHECLCFINFRDSKSFTDATRMTSFLEKVIGIASRACLNDKFVCHLHITDCSLALSGEGAVSSVHGTILTTILLAATCCRTQQMLRSSSYIEPITF